MLHLCLSRHCSLVASYSQRINSSLIYFNEFHHKSSQILIDFSLSCSCLSSCQHPKTQCFWGETHFTSNIILYYCTSWNVLQVSILACRSIPHPSLLTPTLFKWDRLPLIVFFVSLLTWRSDRWEMNVLSKKLPRSKFTTIPLTFQNAKHTFCLILI